MRIRLLQNSTLTRSELDATALGQAHQWLWQDPRIERVRHVDPQPQAPGPHAADWAQGLADLGRGEIGALLWVREDIHMPDFLLADRLQELGLGQWTVRDANGQVAVHIATQADPSEPPHSARALPIAFAVQAGQGAVALSPAQATVPVLLVTASRVSAERFYQDTALGRSVQALGPMGLTVRLMARCGNRLPLAEVYNAAIRPDFAGHHVVFAHDDITLHDWHLASHLTAALAQHDVVGLAGNKTCVPGQPGWAFPQKIGQWAPASQLLGCVGHDTRHNPSAKRKVRMLSRYGAPRGQAALLDGVLLAARIDTLLRTGLRFDPQLAFHFYDLDFCRRALQLGLQPGVWPLAVTHHSGGAFGTPSWQRAYQNYLQKWADPLPHVAC